MSVKTIEIVRKIRDKHYTETKNLSIKEQLEYIKKKAKKLLSDPQRRQYSISDSKKQMTKC